MQPNPNLTYELKNIPNRQQKFRELVLFIAKESKNDERFGATKLNKIMWKSDFEYFLRTGTAITGSKYQRLNNGPVPLPLTPVRRELVNEGALEIQSTFYKGKQQQKPVNLREPDISFFSRTELDLVREIISKNWEKTATQMSDESHGIAWKTRENRELIPYESVYIIDGEPTKEDVERTKKIVDKYGLPKAA